MSDFGWKVGVAGVLLIGTFVGGAALGNWLAKPTIEDLVERNQALYEADSLKAYKLDSASVAYNRLVLDYENEKGVSTMLGDLNEALRDTIKSKNRTIRNFASVEARLRDSLRTVLDNITVTDSLITAEIHAENVYESGRLAADGTVSIKPSEGVGEASLVMEADLHPIIVLSRSEDGVGHCDVTFGDVPVSVYDLTCVDNLGYETPTRGGFFGKIPGLLLAPALVVVGFLVGSLF